MEVDRMVGKMEVDRMAGKMEVARMAGKMEGMVNRIMTHAALRGLRQNAAVQSLFHLPAIGK